MDQDPDKPQAALGAAMEWVLRFHGSADDPQLRADFDAWLARAEENRAAWRQACKAWRALGEVPPVYAHVWAPDPLAVASTAERKDTPALPPVRTPRPAGRHLPSSRRRWRVALPAAGIAACLLLFAAPHLVLRLEADHMTTTAQSRVVTLADGTTVHLAANSAIRSDYSGQSRQVKLLAGEAFFDVARNPDRPFVVDADGVKVEVLGTAFDVRMSSGETSVELAHGAVSVTNEHVRRNAASVLKPGQMLVVDRASGAVTRSDIAQEDIASWRDGRLFVHEATIGAVVEQIQRYHTAWISLPDPALAQQKVTGLYDLRDPDRALRALVQPHGAKMRELSRYVRVLSRF